MVSTINKTDYLAKKKNICCVYMDNNCPQCNEESWRDGHINIGSERKQRYYCRSCDYHFTTHHIRRKLESRKRDFLRLLISEYSVGQMSKQLKVHPSTISRWIGESTEIYQVRTLQVRAIQLFMEGFIENDIADLLGVHMKITRRWFKLFTSKPVLGLPRLVGMIIFDNQVQEIARCFYKNQVYNMVFKLNNEFFKIYSCPEDFKEYGQTYKQIRLAQLYLNGADIEVLLLALKYERMDKLKRKLKATPCDIQNKRIGGCKYIACDPSSLINGDFMIETNNGEILVGG